MFHRVSLGAGLGIPDWFPGGFREVEGEIQWYIVEKQAKKNNHYFVMYGRACILSIRWKL